MEIQCVQPKEDRSPPNKPVSKKKYLYKDIVEQIQEMIQKGDLKIGDKIPPERTLAETFRVSRNCVRQAVQALSEKGILESRRGDGTYVCAVDPSLLVDPFAFVIHAEKDRLRDILEFRLLLEPQVAYLAAKNITLEELDRLKIIVCDQERKILAGETDSDLDQAFHEQIIQASKNKVVQEVFNTINEILNESRSEFLQSGSRRKASVVGHLKIIDALESRDPDMAYQAMKEHILRVEKTVFEPDT